MKIIFFLFLTVICLTHDDIYGQTKADIKFLKKKYSGTWVDTQNKRYLRFYFDDEVDYVTVNDWSGHADPNKSLSSVDAYRAYVKGNRLFVPAYSDNPRCPYCEIEVVNKKLIYTCNEPLNFKDTVLIENPCPDQIIFERYRE